MSALALVGLDADAVRIPQPEPLLRDLRDLTVLALDLALVVDQVPVHLHIGNALDLHPQMVPEPDDAAMEGRDLLAGLL